MVQKQYFFIITLLFFSTSRAQNGDSIETPWASKVTPENVWQEYPRPQLEREQWLNLNGLWDYAITDWDAEATAGYQGKILIPFCVESKLSGVEKPVFPDQKVWYRTSFTVPDSWGDKNILLHFEAVDWETKVWVNDKFVGTHKGGSDPFDFDITDYLGPGKQELKVSVWDPTDTGTQPRGKQVLDPKGIWYTAVTGIWQTVWLEPVEKTYIKSLNPVADIDNGLVIINNNIVGATKDTRLELSIKKDGELIGRQEGKANNPLKIKIKDPKLWSPQSPFLYEVEVMLKKEGKKLDQAKSYFAMRKISRKKDRFGYERLYLNNVPLFQYGTLDQGWWPGGLLTPPSDEAMRFDIDELKKMGFNMLRKHIKVESSRYYYYADKVGILIWQDMVTGFATADRQIQHIRFKAEKDWARPRESADQFEKEWKNILDHLKFFPCIVTWVTFNEGWGQYDTERIVKWTQEYDPTRLVNGVSGWTDRQVGDMRDAHQYPGPGMDLAVDNPGRAIVLGEFGGLGLPVQEHLWNPNMRNWGYRTYRTVEELKKEYMELIKNMAPMINYGLAAAIYTQTTDVEGEVNGLITYDRKVVKIKPGEIRKMNELLYHEPKEAYLILKDSELELQRARIGLKDPFDKNGNLRESDLQEINGKMEVMEGEQAWMVKTLELGAFPQNLQLRIYGVGDVRLLINGEPVLDKFIRTKRHYDDVNLNEHIKTLKKGKNTVVLEVVRADANSPFDFGLYTY